MERSYLPSFVSRWIEEKRVHIEIAFLVGLVLTFSAYWLGLFSPEILMLASLTSSGFYFLSAFLPPAGTENIFTVMCFKLTGIASSVTMVGILFITLGIEGGLNMLVIGTLSLIPAMLYLAYIVLASYTSFVAMVALRAFFLAVAGCYYLMLAQKN